MMAWRVFYSYSHRDAELRARLRTYLAPLKYQEKIVDWCDREIEPGARWESEISGQLESADLIILLVSADFLASEYCFGVEVETALTRLKRSEVKVVPVLLKPCLWEESRFSELQIIPRDAKAITSWSSADEAFKDVATEIRNIVFNPPPSSSNLSTERRKLQQFSLLTSCAVKFVHTRTYTNELANGCVHPTSGLIVWNRSSRKCVH
jgi:TIR domain